MKEFTLEKTLRVAITDKALDTMYDCYNWYCRIGFEYDDAVQTAIGMWIKSDSCNLDPEVIILFFEDIVEMLKVWIQVRDAE